MSDSVPEVSRSTFSDPALAMKMANILKSFTGEKIVADTPNQYYGYLLDVQEGGGVFPSANIPYGTSLDENGNWVNQYTLDETVDNRERALYATVITDEGYEIQARITPEHVPMFRKAKYFNENAPTGTGVMVDSRGVYVNVVQDASGESIIDKSTYPFMVKSAGGDILIEPQAAPRVLVYGTAGSYYVVHIVRGIPSSYTDTVALTRSAASVTPPPGLRIENNIVKWYQEIYFGVSFTSVSKANGTYFVSKTSKITTLNGPSSTGKPDATYTWSDVAQTSQRSGFRISCGIDSGTRVGSVYAIPRVSEQKADLVWVDNDLQFIPPPTWVLLYRRDDSGIVWANGDYYSNNSRDTLNGPANGFVDYQFRGNGVYFKCDGFTNASDIQPGTVLWNLPYSHNPNISYIPAYQATSDNRRLPVDLKIEFDYNGGWMVLVAKSLIKAGVGPTIFWGTHPLGKF